MLCFHFVKKVKPINLSKLIKTISLYKKINAQD
jgi:hypothetical protein